MISLGIKGKPVIFTLSGCYNHPDYMTWHVFLDKLILYKISIPSFTLLYIKF